MVPQLSMDWLVELTSEHYYGPTTLGTLREFIRLGEIDSETVVINSCDGTRRQVRDMPDLWETVPSEADENQFQIQLGDPVGPGVAKMSVRLQERIRELEQTLQEERRALAGASSVMTSWSENTRICYCASLLTRAFCLPSC